MKFHCVVCKKCLVYLIWCFFRFIRHTRNKIFFRYSKQCEDEIKLLRKYRQLTDKESDLLVSELDRFLSQNADKEQILDRRKLNPVAPIEDHEGVELPVNSEDDLIPYHMKTCKYQVDAVNNWMFG